MNYKRVVYSWDFRVSLVVPIIIFFLLPYKISNTFAKDLYSIGITVLSIIFSLYFTALAIIMSSGEDSFIQFLEDSGKYYTTIIGSFKFSLWILFLALVYSLVIYGVTAVMLQNNSDCQPKWFFVVYVFLFCYGLLASLNSILDSISFAKYRTRFLLLKLKKSGELKNEKEIKTTNNKT